MSKTETVKGWAVKRDGAVLIKTVSDTERAAKTRFLVSEQNVPILASYGDDLIKQLWAAHSEGVAVVQVRVLELHAPS